MRIVLMFSLAAALFAVRLQSEPNAGAGTPFLPVFEGDSPAACPRERTASGGFAAENPFTNLRGGRSIQHVFEWNEAGKLERIYSLRTLAQGLLNLEELRGAGIGPGGGIWAADDNNLLLFRRDGSLAAQRKIYRTGQSPWRVTGAAVGENLWVSGLELFGESGKRIPAQFYILDSKLNLKKEFFAHEFVGIQGRKGYEVHAFAGGQRALTFGPSRFAKVWDADGNLILAAGGHLGLAGVDGALLDRSSFVTYSHGEFHFWTESGGAFSRQIKEGYGLRPWFGGNYLMERSTPGFEDNEGYFANEITAPNGARLALLDGRRDEQDCPRTETLREFNVQDARFWQSGIVVAGENTVLYLEPGKQPVVLLKLKRWEGSPVMAVSTDRQVLAAAYFDAWKRTFHVTVFRSRGSSGEDFSFTEPAEEDAADPAIFFEEKSGSFLAGRLHTLVRVSAQRAESARIALHPVLKPHSLLGAGRGMIFLLKGSQIHTIDLFGRILSSSPASDMDVQQFALAENGTAFAIKSGFLMEMLPGGQLRDRSAVCGRGFGRSIHMAGKELWVGCQNDVRQILPIEKVRVDNLLVPRAIDATDNHVLITQLESPRIVILAKGSGKIFKMHVTAFPTIGYSVFGQDKSWDASPGLAEKVQIPALDGIPSPASGYRKTGLFLPD